MHSQTTARSNTVRARTDRPPLTTKPQRERTLTAIAILATLAGTVIALQRYGALALGDGQPLALRLETVAFVFVLLWMLCGSLVFQVTRLFYWGRLQRHQPPQQRELHAIYDTAAPQVCVLIPSYREELRVIRQTVISAALAEYPNRRIVVLLDDPPRGSASDVWALEEARALVRDINHRLEERARHIETVLAERAPGQPDEVDTIAALYEGISDWLETEARREDLLSKPVFAHTDRLFADRILREPAAAHRRLAAELRAHRCDRVELDHHRRRLAGLFDVPIESFERKLYANLSHASNKAMNLNAYIGLMGTDWRSIETATGEVRLEPGEAAEAAIRAPSADFLLVLDADSLVLSDYLLKLVPVIAGEPRMAVIGSPYTAVPRARAVLERVAGATTDVHFCVHQGLTGLNANFWVGACALVRLEALRDIRRDSEEGGRVVPVFISDRTVIEDTEASIDLARAGWTLHSYPERLAYSATPADFGALIIQRRRWANGGLLILPSLLRRQGRSRLRMRGFAELAMRAYYLGALPATTLAMIALLTVPFSDALVSVWLPAAAAPYYFLYGRDLRSCGYRWSDLLRAHALNLLLLPVCLHGVLASIYQGLTGRKAAFGRTPKVEDRTRMPLAHALTQWLILLFVGNVLITDIIEARYLHGIFSLTNAACFLYGFLVLVGARASWADVRFAVLPALQTAQPRMRAALARIALALGRSIPDPLKETALIMPDTRAIAPNAQSVEGP